LVIWLFLRSIVLDAFLAAECVVVGDQLRFVAALREDSPWMRLMNEIDFGRI